MIGLILGQDNECSLYIGSEENEVVFDEEILIDRLLQKQISTSVYLPGTPTVCLSVRLCDLVCMCVQLCIFAYICELACTVCP